MKAQIAGRLFLPCPTKMSRNYVTVLLGMQLSFIAVAGADTAPWDIPIGFLCIEEKKYNHSLPAELNEQHIDTL